MDRFVRAHNRKKHGKPSDPFLNNRKNVNYQLKQMLQGFQTSDNEMFKHVVSKPCVYSSSDSYSDFEDFELDATNGLDINDIVPISKADASNNADKKDFFVNSMPEASNVNNVENDAQNHQQVVNMYAESTSDCMSVTCDDESNTDSADEFDHDNNLALKIIEQLINKGILNSRKKNSKSKKKKKKISQDNNYNMLEIQGIENDELHTVKCEPEIQIENVPDSELVDNVPEVPQEVEQMESEPENEPELENAAQIEVIQNAPEFDIIVNAPGLVPEQNVPRPQLNFDMVDPKVHINGRGPRKVPHDYVSILVNNHPYLPLTDIIGNYKHSTYSNVPSYPGKGYVRKFH